MKLLRIVAALVLATGGGLAAATPVHAGGWATTVLDPLPQRMEVGTGYTVGYWVLQHGFHPFQGDLGATGIRLVDRAGKTTDYQGVRLAEPAHYATAIVFDHAGTFRLYGIQGLFEPYEIGTVTVPGTIQVRPTPPVGRSVHTDSPWGAIHPAGLEGDGHKSATMPSSGDSPALAAEPAAATSGTSRALAPAAAVAAVLVGLLMLAARRWRRSRTGSD